MPLKAFPVLLPFFSVGQVELCHQLLHPLQRDRFAVVVIVANDVLLVLGILGHLKTLVWNTVKLNGRTTFYSTGRRRGNRGTARLPDISILVAKGVMHSIGLEIARASAAAAVMQRYFIFQQFDKMTSKPAGCALIALLATLQNRRCWRPTMPT